MSRSIQSCLWWCQISIVVYTHNPRAWEVESEGLGIQSHPQLQMDFKVSSSYMKLCLKKQEKGVRGRIGKKRRRKRRITMMKRKGTGKQKRNNCPFIHCPICLLSSPPLFPLTLTILTFLWLLACALVESKDNAPLTLIVCLVHQLQSLIL